MVQKCLRPHVGCHSASLGRVRVRVRVSDTRRDDTTPHDTTRHDTTRHDTTRCDTTRCDTTQHEPRRDETGRDDTTRVTRHKTRPHNTRRHATTRGESTFLGECLGVVEPMASDYECEFEPRPIIKHVHINVWTIGCRCDGLEHIAKLGFVLGRGKG